jgi:hypothetical protein|tara:strand:- start:1754 stop:1927 length:174 start_codon:yes stop_codon:yes gene_type:complete
MEVSKMDGIIEDGVGVVGGIISVSLYGMGFLAGSFALYMVSNNLVGALGNSVRARLG